MNIRIQVLGQVRVETKEVDMKITRWAATAALGTLMTAGALVGTAGSAAAVPTGCTGTYLGGNVAVSRCTGGTGEHRVVLLQRHFNPAIGLIACEGPWASPSQESIVTRCAQQTFVGVNVEVR